MRRFIYFTALLSCLSSAAFAQAPLRTTNELRPPVEMPAFKPEELADSIVVFVPSAYTPLHIAENFDRTIEGRVIEVIKGVTPKRITFDANRFTSDLYKDTPVRLYLMRHPKKPDAYYPIAVHPLKDANQ